MTFSIAARCPTTGMFAIAVSSFPAVAARCAHGGPDRSCGRADINQTLLVASTSGSDTQLLMRCAIEARGAFIDFARSASSTRRRPTHRSRTGTQCSGSYNVVCAGNLLKSQQVIAAMMKNWSATEQEHIGDRVLAAMLAGAAGGEEGPVHSAGMLIGE
jgi:uncharacterized Ntn-hydrolase superfamily protein